MNTKILAVSVIAAFAIGALPANAHPIGGVVTHTVRYIVSSGVQADDQSRSLSIWCAPGGHNYAPIGDWDQNPETIDGWLLSGEPECLAGDVATGNQETAIGGSATAINNHLGSLAIILAVDDNTATNVPLNFLIDMTDPNTGNQTDGDGDGTGDPDINVNSCGLGSMSGTIPLNVPDHFQATVPPLKLMWARVRTLGVDSTTSTVCAATAGFTTTIV